MLSEGEQPVASPDLKGILVYDCVCFVCSWLFKWEWLIVPLVITQEATCSLIQSKFPYSDNFILFCMLIFIPIKCTFSQNSRRWSIKQWFWIGMGPSPQKKNTHTDFYFQFQCVLREAHWHTTLTFPESGSISIILQGPVPLNGFTLHSQACQPTRVITFTTSANSVFVSQ